MTQVQGRYVVFDLEATCWAQGQKEAAPEIIEVGAVLYTPNEATEIAQPEYQAFVRPILAPILSEFCIHLTSIDQTDVDSAASFPEVVRAFHRWAEPFAPYALASWGDYDRKQLASDCRLHKVRNPFEDVPHINLKRVFSESHGLKKKDSLGQALRRVGIPRTGVAHRGIDDARNIVRICQAGLGTVLVVRSLNLRLTTFE